MDNNIINSNNIDITILIVGFVSLVFAVIILRRLRNFRTLNTPGKIIYLSGLLFSISGIIILVTWLIYLY